MYSINQSKDFSDQAYRIRMQYKRNRMTREDAIRKLATMYANFYGPVSTVYHEALKSDFYIDEDY